MGTSKMEQTQFVENATCLANHATEEHHPTVLLVAAMLPKSQVKYILQILGFFLSLNSTSFFLHL